MNSDSTTLFGLPEAPTAASDRDAGRFHHLDALRAFALLLGVLFHAAQSFGVHNYYWAIVDSSPSTLLERVGFGSHSFRMALFFLIAGFFARLLMLRRGTAGFVWNRIQRILVPLVVGWVVLYPAVVYLWLWGASVSGGLARLGLPSQLQHVPAWKLALGFFISGGFVKKLDLAHLWFLHQLLVIYAGVVVARWAWSLTFGARAQALPGDRWFAGLCQWPGAVFVFALLCLPILLTMKEWGVDTPSTALRPYVPTTLFYGLCFLIGWMLHRQPDLVDGFGSRWPWHLALGTTLCVWLGGTLDSVPLAGLLSKQVHSMRLAFLCCYAVMLWSFALGFLGLFARFCRRPNAWGRYLADASYWIYLVHLPLVVALQIVVAQANVAWPLKYAFIVAGTIVVSLLSHHYLIRPTWIGLQLNGRRYPRRWPWSGRPRRTGLRQTSSSPACVRQPISG